MDSKIEKNLDNLYKQWDSASEKNRFLETHSLHGDLRISDKKIQLAGKPRIVKWFVNKINQYVNYNRYNTALKNLENFNEEISHSTSQDVDEKKKKLSTALSSVEAFVKKMGEGSRKNYLLKKISLLSKSISPESKKLDDKRFWTHQELLESDLDGKDVFEFAEEYLRSERKDALELYKKAAGKGYVPAMLKVANELRYGFNDGLITIEKDPSEALKIYEAAFQKANVDNNKREACQALGNMYNRGEGIEKNPELAEKWFNEGRKYGPILRQDEHGSTILPKRT